MNITIVPAERGAVCEAHVKRADGAVIAMYRYRKQRWEHRSGWGEVWRRCDRPGSELPAEILRRLESV